MFPDRNKYKIEFSDEYTDLVQKLLEKDKTKRLGSKNGAKEILDHAFFKGFDIEALENKAMKPPFVPEIDGEMGTEEFLKYFNAEDGQAIKDTHIPK